MGGDSDPVSGPHSGPGAVLSVLQAALFWLALLLSPAQAWAGTLLLEGGVGDFHSRSDVAALRYQHAAPLLLNHEGYYELSVAGWNGDEHNRAIGASRGLVFPLSAHTVLAGSAGIGLVERLTTNLGTHGQFLFRLALETHLGPYEFSLAQLHYSNAQMIFNWSGKNRGENFIVVALGRQF